MRACKGCLCICTRTTLNLDDELLAKAQNYTGITEKTRLVHLGLEALIQRHTTPDCAGLLTALPTERPLDNNLSCAWRQLQFHLIGGIHNLSLRERFFRSV
jgi:Arc/MetJ family transcription regulator